MKISHSKITASVNTGMSYWYLFKHGLGPGTMPKDCHLLKVIEDGWKDYVFLDRMLTTDELNEFEIREATPSEDLLRANGYNSLEETYEDVTSDTEVAHDEDADSEEEDEWAMPKGVYHVSAFGNDYGELQSSFDFKDPKSAIIKWIELQKKWPLNVMITGFQEEEENLRKYVTEHPDWYRQLSAKFNCPYDAEYIIDECAKPVRPRTGQYANKYTDQCHPFGLG